MILHRAPQGLPLAAEDTVRVFGHVVLTRAFAIGLVYGALAYLLTGVFAALRHRTTEGAGIAFAGALVLALRDTYGTKAAPNGLVLALVLLGAGGALARRMRPRVWADWYVGPARTALALLPGAIALGASLPYSEPSWLRFGVATAAVSVGALVHDFDGAHGALGGPWVLFAIAALGVYYTVPDTELALVLLGVCGPLAFLSFPQPLRRIGPAGTTAAVGGIVWVVAVGGHARAGAFFAGVATLGLMIVEPLGRRIPKSTLALARQTRRVHRDRWPLVIAVASLAQLLLCVYCAKVAGRESDAGLALLMLLPALVLLGAAAPYLLPVVTGRTRSPQGRSGRHTRRPRHRVARPSVQ
jgi:hypothetical protein